MGPFCNKSGVDVGFDCLPKPLKHPTFFSFAGSLRKFGWGVETECLLLNSVEDETETVGNGKTRGVALMRIPLLY